MEIPAVTHEEVLDRLRKIYYDVVPATLQTYCAVTARISQRVLRHFGIDAQLLPCQLWWAGPSGNFVVGFYQKDPKQWGGHVVCTANGWLLDAALQHLRRHMNVEVPGIVLKKCFDIPSNVLARHDLAETERLWWHHAPPGVDKTIPEEPEAIVAQHANALIARMQQELQQAAAAGNAAVNDARGGGPMQPR